ncbi:hypothetical protein [Corallococcus exiguus]|uniref:hypothetical protein n=1 Tax=Corallococcus exiguus TaxID=83462 RepID=UPI003DA5420B
MQRQTPQEPPLVPHSIWVEHGLQVREQIIWTADVWLSVVSAVEPGTMARAVPAMMPMISANPGIVCFSRDAFMLPPGWGPPGRSILAR